MNTKPIWVTSDRFNEDIQGKVLCMDFPQAPSPHCDLGDSMRVALRGTLDFKCHEDGRIAISVILSQPFGDGVTGLRLTEKNISRVVLDRHHLPDYALSFDHPAESILVCPRQTDS